MSNENDNHERLKNNQTLDPDWPHYDMIYKQEQELRKEENQTDIHIIISCPIFMSEDSVMEDWTDIKKHKM